jgi:hypothetical protein
MGEAIDWCGCGDCKTHSRIDGDLITDLAGRPVPFTASRLCERGRSDRGPFWIKRRNTRSEQIESALPLTADSSRTSLHVREVPILLQKSFAADGPSAISLSAAGFDPPTLTPSTQLQRYAKHKA